MTQPSGPLLEADGLTKRYGERTVLRDVSLRLARGERLALMGPSGSGKSTLLNCLGGVDRADAGTLHFDGRAMHGMPAADLAALRRQHIGTVFQFFHLLPTLTASENIELPLQLNRVPPAERRQRVGSLLERVGITDRASALPGELSGGEMQRVAIARALVHRPQLLLADEPTGNLDSASGSAVLALLQELSDETGTALMVVTHSAEAAAICHRTVFLRDGQLTAPCP